MNLVLLGPPGAGKGTQARRLRDAHGLTWLSTGDLLRHAIANDTEVGRLAREPIDRGDLVPDELIVRMIAEELAGVSGGGFLLDGFPRTIPQAEALERILGEQNMQLDCVIELRADDDALIVRLAGRFTCASCGATYHDTLNPPKRAGICDVCGGTAFSRRTDDAPETVRARLREYHRQTAPLLDFYRARGLLRTIDALADIETVTRQMESVLQEA